VLQIPDKWNAWRVPYRGFLGDQSNGFFLIQPRGLTVIVSTGYGWEHASVSRRSSCPTYEDMDYVKRSVWAPEDCAMQLHVPESEHISRHPYCLHLWRPLEVDIPRPPAILV
jgi:hypothetical protein